MEQFAPPDSTLLDLTQSSCNHLNLNQQQQQYHHRGATTMMATAVDDITTTAASVITPVFWERFSWSRILEATCELFENTKHKTLPGLF